ncbi:MAG: hypothetical protein HW389_3816 [Bacteroidetes bacterium]|nr:hypothetical protein [Bacteroidota bacterium]
MTQFYFAWSYATQTLNETLFDELLTTVDQASIDIFPKFRLGNAIAKKKARLLRAKKEDFF